MVAQLTNSDWIEEKEYNTFVSLLGFEGTELEIKVLMDNKVISLNEGAEGYLYSQLSGGKYIDLADFNDSSVLEFKRMYVSYYIYSRCQYPERATHYLDQLNLTISNALQNRRLLEEQDREKQKKVNYRIIRR